MRVLLTGASGFVGSHVLRHLLTNTDWEIVCPTTFSHKGVSRRIESSVCDQPDEIRQRVTIVHWDMRSAPDLLTRRAIGPIDAFWNIASESHVDRSITNPVPFVENNVSLMLRALEYARTLKPAIFLQMSTDEVYGPAYRFEEHTEWSAVVPSNPYSASKAAQEAIAISYWRTYGVPLVITNTMNIIGEMQDPEKFVPLVIRSLRDRMGIAVHCSPEGHPGSRFYLHARNLADAWLWLTNRYVGLPEIVKDPEAGDELLITIPPGVPLYTDGVMRPARYNIVGEREVDNIEMVKRIGLIMGVDQREVDALIRPVSFHSSRPGHDLRYALDGTKITDLGWRAPVTFDDSLERTVKWTLEHPEWLEL